MEQTQYLKLDGDRIVSFSDRGRAFTYTLRRLTIEDWKQCWSAMQFTTESKKGESTQQFDQDTPSVELVMRCVIGVEGYNVTNGEPFTSMPNWQKRLRVGHLVHVGGKLQDVRFDDDADANFTFDPEYEIVRLKGQWGSVKPGEMIEHRGLLHKLNPLSIEQQRRVHRAKSQSIVVGGSRSDQTIYPSIHHLYVELYDELIVEVEGYAVGGKPISSADQARNEMDAAHKVGAVLALFRAPLTSIGVAG